MGRHDEHGDVDASTHEHGPEWWAMDREFFCDNCGHSAYRHRERLSDTALAPCGECACEDFQSEEADDPQPTFEDLIQDEISREYEREGRDPR